MPSSQQEVHGLTPPCSPRSQRGKSAALVVAGNPLWNDGGEGGWPRSCEALGHVLCALGWGLGERKGVETREAKNIASTSGRGEGGGELRAEFPEKQAGTGNLGV